MTRSDETTVAPVISDRDRRTRLWRRWSTLALAVLWLAPVDVWCASTGEDGSEFRPVGEDARGTPVGSRSANAPFAESNRVGEGGELRGAAVAAHVHAAIAARLAEEDCAIEVRPPGDATLRGGPAELAVELPETGVCPGSMTATVRLHRDGVMIRVLRVSATVRCWQVAPVVASGKRRGDLLSESDVRMERREVPRRDQVFSSIDELIGLRARRALRPGHLLVTGDLEPVPLVHEGHPVTAVLVRGAIEVEMRAVMLEDGWLGDVVRIRNPITRGVMRGIVTGSGLIELEAIGNDG